MSRKLKPTTSPRKASVDVAITDEVALLTVTGLVDEHFTGLGDIGAAKIVILNVAGITRMTSFGVRQWLNSLETLPRAGVEVYLLGCPTFFVDQLNMVLNFGGPAKILTVLAPYTCPTCNLESGEMVDVLAERANLAKGVLPDRPCSKCRGKLEFDETPESYFAFASKYAASSIQPAAAQLLAARGLYTSPESATEKPPRIIKLVHGSVTYFRIIGTIGSMFRARPILVGAEGEVVIDLAEVDRFDATGQKEWRRLLKGLSSQVAAVTLVDVNELFLAAAGDSFVIARNIVVLSVLVPYSCVECNRTSRESMSLEGVSWPLQFAFHVCTTCGGITRSVLPAEALAPLQKSSTNAPAASAKVVRHRDELVSRAMTDAKVAQAGDSASAEVGADDILGKYKIVRRLSAGGMADVFFAKQVSIGGFEKPVALKRIQRKLLETRHLAIDMFLNEAKIAGRLMHPNIVQVLDVGEVGGALYLAMEYVHGKDLRHVARKLQQTQNLMPLGVACYVVREVCMALDHAFWSMDMDGNRLSVVHRDVSPHNIILGYDGTVKLLDFGVAMSSVTEHAEGVVVGKWLYMSPEATTSQALDHRSDLFSLGVILYLLCSATLPFTSPEPREIVRKIRAGEYKPLREVAPHVPERLANLVGRLLAANQADRPERGVGVANELTEIARDHGWEFSGQNIAQFLAELTPNELAASEEVSIKEIVRVAHEDMGSLTVRDDSPVSITPGTSSKLLSAIDVSETFRRASREFTAQGDPQRTSNRMAAPAPPTSDPAPEPDSAPHLEISIEPDPGTGSTQVSRISSRASLIWIAVVVAVALAIGAYLVVFRS